MTKLEQMLHAEYSGGRTFATVLTLAFYPDDRRVIAIRAGHPGMLLHGAGTVEWLEPPGGLPLGFHADDWPEQEIQLPDGHGLLLLTDGLFEGHSGRGDERLGEDGLLALARSLSDLPGPAFVDALIVGAAERAQTHGGLTDDIAVVRIERTPR
jgi:serine phosphatase RsbU (regulator of sigma subunit)